MKYRILIVEDDPTIAFMVKKHAESWGYEVFCVTDFKEVLRDFAAFGPHLVLMDISLPFFNGYHWCNEIRKVSKTPIIFVSSSSDNINIVMAVNMGGDDFIAKPFDLDVLTAKIAAMVRRTYDFAAGSGIMEAHGAVLCTGDATLSYEGTRVELTKNEFRIIQVLMESRGSIVSRDRLMTKLWESDSFVDDNTLTVNMTRLRRKLEDAGLYDFIVTKKGLGYLVE